jgi:hypothetical protein
MVDLHNIRGHGPLALTISVLGTNDTNRTPRLLRCKRMASSVYGRVPF